jgi:hypothetical protein
MDVSSAAKVHMPEARRLEQLLCPGVLKSILCPREPPAIRKLAAVSGGCAGSNGAIEQNRSDDAHPNALTHSPDIWDVANVCF